MALLAVFAVIVASTLISQGSRALAAAVLAASAFGPMTVVGAPLDESKYGEVAGANASFPLHLGVAVGLLALLAGWTVWVVRRSGTASRTQRPRSERRHDALMFGVLFALGNTVGVLLRPDTDETPSYLTVVCWTAMAAAAATALWHSRGMRSALITVLPALTLGAMYVAYFRPGGWAGVAGWELWTSPILFGIPSVAMSLSAPVAVWVARGVRAAMANGRSSALAPATS
jgi:hypothetical protein